MAQLVQQLSAPHMSYASPRQLDISALKMLNLASGTLQQPWRIFSFDPSTPVHAAQLVAACPIAQANRVQLTIAAAKLLKSRLEKREKLSASLRSC